MPSLASSFHSLHSFTMNEGYKLLPFRFHQFDTRRSVLTNLAGEHAIVLTEKLPALIEGKLPNTDLLLDELESKHMICRGALDAHCELLAAQIRTRQSLLPDMAALHIFVVTLRCDQACRYCQVSRVSEDKFAYDMTEEAADRGVDLMLASPAQRLKVEFQGGESLLNFPLIRRIIERCASMAGAREISYVVATNLAVVADDMLAFFRQHEVYISTSLDGPAALHNHNRPRLGQDAHARTIDGIRRCRESLGKESVSALMTCSQESLGQPEAIIDEYVRHGFTEIFLREVSPYGYAAKPNNSVTYATSQYLEFYERGLSYILKLNRLGVRFREVYASILLTRMLTSTPTGYVDLQSPAGAGFGALVYNYDGKVYASDEGRMLAEMGDHGFCLGNLSTDTWDSIYLNSPILDIAYRTMTEGLPGCCDCAYQPWCGSDPVRHHATQGDVMGHRPTSAFCQRNKGIFHLLLEILESGSDDAKTLRSWAR